MATCAHQDHTADHYADDGGQCSGPVVPLLIARAANDVPRIDVPEVKYSVDM